MILKRTNKYLKIIIFLITVITAPNALHPQQKDGSTTAEVLAFEDFLEKVHRHDPAFERILLRELYLKYEKDLQMPPDDLLLEVTGEYGFFRSNDNSITNDDTSGTVTLSRMFSRTGTEASVSFSRISAVTTGVTRYQSTMNLQISQNIVRDAFGHATRMLEDKIEIETGIIRLRIIEAYEDYLASLLTLYLDWHRAYERRLAAEKSFNEEKQVLNLIRRKRRLGVAFPDEVSRAELTVVTAEEALAGRVNEEKNRRLQIIYLAGLKTAADVVPRAVDFTEIFRKPAGKGSEAESRTETIYNRLVQAGVLEADIAADNLLPSAKIFAGYDLLSPQFNLTRPDHKIYFGAGFKLNFTNNRNSARSEVADLNRKDARLERSRAMLNLEVDLETISNHLSASEKILRLSKRRLNIAARAAAQVRRKFNLGQADFIDLASARRSLVEARVDLVEKEALNAQLKLEQRRLRDTLVVKLPSE